MPDSIESLIKEAIRARRAGDSTRALSYARRARENWGPELSPWQDGQIALLIGNSLADGGDFSEADEELRRAGQSFLSAGWNTEYAQVQISRGRILAERELDREALAFFTDLERLELPAELRSQVLNNLGILNRRLGNMSEAIHFLSLDTQLSETLGDAYGTAVAHFNLAGVLGLAARQTEKAEHAERAASLFRQSGRADLAAQAEALRNQT